MADIPETAKDLIRTGNARRLFRDRQ